MNTRILHTKIWKDEFVAGLTPTEKLLFVYFLTNERVNIIHCYEITEREIIFDTGVDRGILGSFKEKIETAGKMLFYKNYVYLKNAARYEKYTGDLNETAKKSLMGKLPTDVNRWLDRGIYSPSSLEKTDRGLIPPRRPLGVARNHKSEIINQKPEIRNHKSIPIDADCIPF